MPAVCRRPQRLSVAAGAPVVSATTGTADYTGVMADTHHYTAQVAWAGSTGVGYAHYTRTHEVTAGSGNATTVTADVPFRGEPGVLNPEELLLTAAVSCQLLSFLAVAAKARLDVVRYADSARAVMPGDVLPQRITDIYLNPQIMVCGRRANVQRLVEVAHRECFIAHSLTATFHICPTVDYC